MELENINKLTAALYRVTERFDDQEPMKWRLRKYALEISTLYPKRTKNLGLGEVNSIPILLEEMVRLLELCSSFSYIARINFEVLLREYNRLKSQTNETGKILLEKETVTKIQHNIEPSENIFDRNSLNDRKQQIMKELSKTGPLSIGELAKLIGHEMSEKTLQRDLNDLIKERLVDAEGERRWRTYRLVLGENK